MRGFSRISAVVFCGVIAGGYPCRGQATSPLAPEPGNAGAAAAARKHAKVAALVADASKLYEAKQFKEAADLLRQATLIDPQDTNAALMLRLVIDKITDQQTYDLVQRRAAGGINAEGGDRVVPRPFVIAAPFAFAVTNAPPAADKPIGESAKDRAARDRLEENLVDLTATAQPLDKILMFLRDNMAATILVNWAALHEAGIEKNVPLTTSIKNVPFRQALTSVLSQAAGDKVQLGYTISDGTIIISTKADLTSAAYQVDRSYDVRDMVLGGSARVSGAGNTEVQMPDPAETAKQRAAALVNLIDTIRTTVAPETWKDAGGTIGTIREENGRLVIHQTRDNQIAVYELLRQLRETRSIQIAMESRIILVSSNALDDFRIAWSPDGKPALATTPASAPATPPIVAPKPKGDFPIAIIDNWTLSQMLTATQADKRTLTFTAPRLTLFNGGEAALQCAMPLRYLSGYSAKPVPIESDPYTPDYASTDTGLKLTVQVTVSADRRYLVTQWKSVSRVPTGVEQNVAPNNPAGQNLKIEKPTIKMMTGESLLAIPDGGTLLIDCGEVPPFGEAGQPLAEALKDKRHILILVRPNIIIRSSEEDLFGVGYDRPTGLSGNTQPATTTKP